MRWFFLVFCCLACEGTEKSAEKTIITSFNQAFDGTVDFGSDGKITGQADTLIIVEAGEGKIKMTVVFLKGNSVKLPDKDAGYRAALFSGSISFKKDCFQADMEFEELSQLDGTLTGCRGNKKVTLNVAAVAGFVEDMTADFNAIESVDAYFQ